MNEINPSRHVLSSLRGLQTFLSSFQLVEKMKSLVQPFDFFGFPTPVEDVRVDSDCQFCF